MSNVTITIDSTNRESLIDWRSVVIKSRINEKANTCEFIYKKYGSRTFVPVVNEEVIVLDTDGTTKLFGGVISNIEETQKNDEIIVYKVQCVDYSVYLRRQLVTERYESETVNDIIADLVSNYTSAGDSITDNNVNAPITIESIAFNRLSVSQAIQKLADALSYSWYVDYDKDIHFFPKNDETCPFGIEDDNGAIAYNSLMLEEDFSQLRNSVTIEGGEAEGNTRTEVFTGADLDGNSQIPLVYKYSAKPTVTVDSGGGAVAQTVGIDFIDDDASFDVMWSFNQKYLRWTSGNEPSTGDDIEVSGNPLYPIIVRVPSPISISTYGEFQYAIKDRTIRSQDEAIDRALAELDAYSQPIVKGSVVTYKTGARAGQVVTINSTSRNRTEQLVIQTAITTFRNPDGSSRVTELQFSSLKEFGIIDWFQRQLSEREITEDEGDTLLTYLQFSDSFTMTDDITITQTSPPYVYAPDAGNTAEWNKATWS